MRYPVLFQISGLNAKHDIAIAELDLEVTKLTASLHKEQEKVVSHSVRIAAIEKQIQNFIADNNRLLKLYMEK